MYLVMAATQKNVKQCPFEEQKIIFVKCVQVFNVFLVTDLTYLQ